MPKNVCANERTGLLVMTQGYIFSTSAFIAAIFIGMVMGAAWVFGQLVNGCKAIDSRIDKILEGCL